MASHVILAIDVGTQSLRASLVDEYGNICNIATRNYQEPFRVPQSGYAEQDADFYYRELGRAVRQLRDENPVLFSQVKSMVVATFRDTAVVLDEDKKPLRPMILWLDQRMARLEGEKHIPQFNKMLFYMVGMWETVKLNSRRTAAMWLRENQPELWKKVKYYVPLGAYLNYKLTGELKVSDSDVVGHYAFDFKHRKYYGEKSLKYSVFGIDREMNAELVKTGDVIGTINSKSSRETSLPIGVKLIASGSDKACEVLGNGCIEGSKAAISLGTACTINIPCDRYVEPEPFLPAYGAAYPGSYNDEVQIYRGFWLLKWFAENFASYEDLDSAREKDLPLECLMDHRIEDIVPGSDGLLVQPYWGPGLRRPLARGAMVGFRDFQDKNHIYRASIEGIAFCLKEGMEEMNHRMHNKVKSIVVSGGGSRNDIIAQILADIFNLPVTKTMTTESTTIGAAMAGFLAEGVFETPREAVESMVHYKTTFMPNKENVKIYARIYKEAYLKLYPKLDKIYEKLDVLAKQERALAKNGKRKKESR